MTAIISFTLFKCIEILAGKETLANINLKFLGDFNFAFSLSIVSTITTSTGWYSESKKRKEDIKKLTKENKELRRQLDKNLSSSHLEADGSTNRKDL